MTKNNDEDALRPYEQKYAELDAEFDSGWVPSQAGNESGTVKIADIELEREETVVDGHNMLVIYIKK
jgi:hypothetical protein